MDRTERLLRTLFDFQRFSGNQRLDRVICAVQETEGVALLEDSELDLNAAGGPNVRRILKRDGKKP